MGYSAHREAAPAKINLYLHITGKRGDGYHLLDSISVFAPDIADTIEILVSDAFSFCMEGPFAAPLQNDDQERNLAVRAARLFTATTGLGGNVSIRLQKNIPAGAGLGGGSADAAAVIRAMEKLFGQDLPDRTHNLLSLGADVPVCYRAGACRFEGVGEQISGIPALPEVYILIVWPSCHSSTKDIFSRYTSAPAAAVAIPHAFGTVQKFSDFLTTTQNDLYEAASSLLPEIASARASIEKQNGCIASRMSGSGSAVFGLFADKALCEEAGKAVQAAHPSWWVKSSVIA